MHMCVVSVNMQERRRKEVIARKRLERAQDKDGLHIEVLVCVCVCARARVMHLSYSLVCLPACLSDCLLLNLSSSLASSSSLSLSMFVVFGKDCLLASIHSRLKCK